jgi:uncharacterized membrane protein
MDIKSFFTNSEQQAIREAIAKAELNTSGEIRIHLDATCKGEPVDRAIQIFAKLKMHKTELRNGVLFFLALEDKKFAIIGDKGINDSVPSDFWDSIRNKMVLHFQKDEFTAGICLGIEMAGNKLKTHFPFQQDDVNELSNEISFEE